jgi:hypothetical protein
MNSISFYAAGADRRLKGGRPGLILLPVSISPGLFATFFFMMKQTEHFVQFPAGAFFIPPTTVTVLYFADAVLAGSRESVLENCCGNLLLHADNGLRFRGLHPGLNDPGDILDSGLYRG